MHVCQFCDNSLEGAYFKNLTLGLVQKGVKVTLVTLGDAQRPTWLNEGSDVKYVALGAINKIQYLGAMLRLGRLLKTEKVDILQTHLYYAGLLSVVGKRFSPKTIVALTRHHTGVVRMLGSAVHVKLDKWMAEQADYVVAPSLGTANYIKNVDKIRADVSLVYYGFDFKSLTATATDRRRVRDEFQFKDKNFVIGYIGNFAEGKGHIQLIRAFRNVCKELPDARLFFVGKGNLDEVDNAVKEYGLTDKIIFAGWRDDVAACVSAMDLFVQPSLSEAFSQVLIEAMSGGIPVIATNVGGANEVIENGENGFLIEPNDIEALSDRILRMFASREQREQFGIAGRETVLSNYTVERMVDEQFALYTKWMKRINGI